MRTCLFCDRTDLSLEHVWPDWISKLLWGQPKKGRFTALRFTGAGREPIGKPFKAAELNHKARIVCGRDRKGCNQEWMSQVETYAKGVLIPLLRGQSVTLDKQDQVILRAWIILRTMVFALSSSAAEATPFYTREEHRTFADIEYEGSLEPIDGTYIWIFQYRTPRWAARSHVVNGGIHDVPGGPQTHRFQVITAFIGRFGFQTLVARWPEPRRLELNSVGVHTLGPAMALLSPHTSDTIEWPPNGFYLGDDSYETLLDRLIKPGMPVEKKR
jgi:hypothetical protein